MSLTQMSYTESQINNLQEGKSVHHTFYLVIEIVHV